MSLVSPVFEQHYKDYLLQLASLDIETIGTALGGEVLNDPQGTVVSLPYFNKDYRVSSQGITDSFGEKAGYDICIVLCRYLIMGREPRDNRVPDKASEWVGFRDLKESGPLTVYFKDNVEQVILNALTGRLAEFKAGMGQLKCREPDLDVQYDLAVVVDGLPRIPMLILFNDAEEGFPASCSVLFDRQVETYLDAECIAMVGYRLAVLIGNVFS